MSSMFFGQYLLEKGIINRDALLDAIERQRINNKSIPELAVDEGLLAPAQADLISSIFRLSSRTIEEICTSEGGLTADALQRLLDKQRSNRMLIGDALVQGGHLSADQVEASHRTFRDQEERERQTLEADFDHLEETSIVRTCTELTLRHVSRVGGVPVKLSEVGVAAGELEEGSIRFALNVVGSTRLCIALDLGHDLLMRVAQGMLGSPKPVDLEAALDAACELVNVVGGNACTHLEIMGHRLRPEPPTWSRVAAPAGGPSTTWVRARAMAGDDPFELNLAVD